VDDLTKYGVVLKSITEPFDTANAAGKMMLQMLGVFAEFEHATIVERTKVGMEKKAKGGGRGRPPFGYGSVREGPVAHEEEALIVRRLPMYARERAHTICKEFNGRPAEPQRPAWGAHRLYMLKNPVTSAIRWREIYDEPIRWSRRAFRTRRSLRRGEISRAAVPPR
jgi:hypothetical protein